MELPRDAQSQLDSRGYIRVPNLMSSAECTHIAAYWQQRDRFRSEVVMSRHGYGSGSYRYFDRPLPSRIEELRKDAYEQLVPLANLLNERLGIEDRFPENYESFLDRCRAAGQTKTTPLLLRYEEGDFNRLHQDQYGEVFFPFQLVIMLSRSKSAASASGSAEVEFEGGEFLLTETRPRMQAKGTAVSIAQGEGIIFPSQLSAAESSRGYSRAGVRHGVSEVTRGKRVTLGVILHDAN